MLRVGGTCFEEENKGADTFLPGQGKTSNVCGQWEAGDDSWPKLLTFLFVESAGKLAGAGDTYSVFGFVTSSGV